MLTANEAKLCRVCLNDSGSLSLFGPDDVQFSFKIMQCVNINIMVGDGLPDHICQGCAAELTITYDFIKKCETSNATLRSVNLDADKDPSIFKQEFKEEDIDYNSQDNDNFSGDFQLKEEIQIKKRRKYTKRKSYDRRKLRRKAPPLQCTICGVTTTCHSAMDDHMRTHTGEKPFQCEYCNKREPTKGALKRHIVTHHTVRERRYICETCGSGFYGKNGIIAHLRIHTDDKPYQCPFCPNKFRQISSLIRHKRKHTGERPFKCDICSKKFMDTSSKKKHMLVHTDEKKFCCPICKKAVKSKEALKSHIKTHSNEKNFLCSFCSMAFTFKGNLKTHIRRAHSDKAGQCTICHKEFSNLEIHMRKHTGEKPMICKFCDQGFATQRSLSYHIMFRHENASKYTCSLGNCSKSFPTVTMLEFHLLKQHTNHTPYVCQHCSRGFFRGSDLSRHLRVTHNQIASKPQKSA